MADVTNEAGERIRVRADVRRKLAGVLLPLWCAGKSGSVVRVEGDMIVAKLDDVSARELRFQTSELEHVA